MSERESRLLVKVRDAGSMRSLVQEAGSYREVAEKVGVTFGYLGHLVNGRRDRVGLGVAVRLSGVLGVRAGELFELPEQGVLLQEGII